MLELMVKLESARVALREKLLPTVGSNDFHAIGAILALVFASGTLLSGFVSAPISFPVGGYALAVFWITGILAVLTVVLLPLGLIFL